jgi:hypothetical protein
LCCFNSNPLGQLWAGLLRHREAENGRPYLFLRASGNGIRR